jgi:hypothetical protein
MFCCQDLILSPKAGVSPKLNLWSDAPLRMPKSIITLSTPYLSASTRERSLQVQTNPKTILLELRGDRWRVEL